jgi:hypothetical protein
MEMRPTHVFFALRALRVLCVLCVLCVPQLAAQSPDSPTDFVLAALARHPIVFLGDVHPIAEPKQILADVIARQDPAAAIDLLALEVGAEQQPFIDAYLRSEPEDTTLLVENPRTLRAHWGASHEYLGVYRAIYRWNHDHPSRPIAIAASDLRGWPIAPLTEMMAAGGFANRDEWMARSFAALAQAHPEWRILIFMGGYHGLQMGGGEVEVGRTRARFDSWFCGYLREGGIPVYTILTDARQEAGHGATRVYDELATRGGENFAVALDVATDSIRQPMYEVAMEGYKLSFWPDRFPLRLAANAMIVLETSSPITPLQ